MLESVLQRRSCRQFTQEPIDPEKLKQILLAGPQSPSASNTQKRRYTLISDPKKVQDLADFISDALDYKKGAYHLYHATSLILISGPRDYKYVEADCCAATQNMLVAADILGVGAVWINQFRHIDSPLPQALLDLSIPEDHWIVCAIALGNPQKEIHGDKKSQEIIHWIK